MLGFVFSQCRNQSTHLLNGFFLLGLPAAPRKLARRIDDGACECETYQYAPGVPAYPSRPRLGHSTHISIEKRFVLLLILYAIYPSFPITSLNLSLLITYHSLSTYLLALSVILHAHPAAMMTLSDSYA